MLTTNFKKLLLVTTMTAAFSASADAAVYSVSSSAIPVGAFSYTVNFSVLSGNVASITGQVDSIFRSNGATKVSGFDISDVTLSMGTLTKSDVETVTPLVSTYTTTADTYSFFNNALAAGNYILTVSGTSYSSNASFSGGFEVVASAVPEPQTSGLIALGLGLIGLISLRKKQ